MKVSSSISSCRDSNTFANVSYPPTVKIRSRSCWSLNSLTQGIPGRVADRSVKKQFISGTEHCGFQLAPEWCIWTVCDAADLLVAEPSVSGDEQMLHPFRLAASNRGNPHDEEFTLPRV